MANKERLLGKRALVTGGSRGLGLAICEAFAQAGAAVAFTFSKNTDDAEVAKRKLSAYGNVPLVFKGSVSDAAHVKETINSIKERWKPRRRIRIEKFSHCLGNVRMAMAESLSPVKVFNDLTIVCD